jgi:RsiG-like
MSAARSTRSERADRIVEPAFIDGLEDLSTDEIRARRDEARAELESLSYLRRHMQSWQDMLQAERSARGKPGNFRQPLAEVLSGHGQVASRGEAVRLQPTDEDIAAAEALVDDLLGGAAFARLKDLDEESLDRGIETLDGEERRVSSDRAAVIRVHDRLQEELKHRYRDDPTQIPKEV